MKKALLFAPLALALPMAALVAAHHEAKDPHAGHMMVDASKISGGDYVADQHHTQVLWTVNHFGFNDYFGLFGQITGTLSLDKANPANSKVKVTIPVNELATSRADLTKHMMGGDFLDAAKFATASFESTAVEVTGQNAKITGNLTLLGVTKPVVLDAKLTGAGKNIMNQKETVGFHAKTKIKRSEWGMAKYVPAVGDEVTLKISAAFEK